MVLQSARTSLLCLALVLLLLSMVNSAYVVARSAPLQTTVTDEMRDRIVGPGVSSRTCRHSGHCPLARWLSPGAHRWW
jgi:hypothetical protein